MNGPYGTERQAREAAHPWVPAGTASTEGNRQMLLDVVNSAGIELGDYDRRILDWLAGWEPSTCAVIAGLISRAAAGRQNGGQR